MNYIRNSLLAFLAITGVFASQGFAQSRYEQIKNFIQLTSQQFPQNVKIITVGDSDSGDKIYGLEIGNGPVHNLVVATHHGNEFGSTAVATFLAASLARDPIAGQTVYVIPVLNITGYNSVSRRESAKGTTFDPNRDYPGPCDTAGPFSLKSTASLAKFVADKNIIVSATLHTYFPGVLYPWGISTRDTETPYDPLFISMGKAATVESGYVVGNSRYLLYAADGTFEDYAFWQHGIWSMLFEMGRTHSPDQGDIQELARVNVPGIRRMLAMAPTERAANHAFTGRCDRMSIQRADRHLE